MYTVRCKYCSCYYESRVNRPGICHNCKKTETGRKNTRYRDRTYDQIMFYVPKGEKESLKAYVAGEGISMNEFINQAIDFYIAKREEEKKPLETRND